MSTFGQFVGGLSMMRTIFIVIAAVLVSAPGRARPLQSAASSDEVITIDGAKNPEQIPQWSAWASSFQFIAAGARTFGVDGIPTPVYRVLTTQERPVLLRYVDAAIREQKECEAKALKLRGKVGIEKPEALQQQLLDLQMECRRATLKARDAVLAELAPAGQAALRDFVESQKHGQTVTLLKSELPRFRLPE